MTTPSLPGQRQWNRRLHARFYTDAVLCRLGNGSAFHNQNVHNHLANCDPGTILESIEVSGVADPEIYVWAAGRFSKFPSNATTSISQDVWEGVLNLVVTLNKRTRVKIPPCPEFDAILVHHLSSRLLAPLTTLLLHSLYD